MARRLVRLGVVSNPGSHRNRRRGPGLRELAKRRTLPFAETRTGADLAPVLADFARREVSVVVIDGGDGTIQSVLTALPEAYPADPPALAILAAGGTNLIAADVGGAGHGPRALDRLADAADTGSLGRRIATRPVLEIARPGSGLPALRGMFFGAAAFRQATAMARTRVHTRGISQAPAVALTIGMALARILAGGDDGALARGEPISAAADDQRLPGNRRFLVLGTTLDRLMLGIWPFWGDGVGPIRYLDVAAPPRRLAAAIVPALRGRPKRWMAESGYRSGRARSLTLELTTPFVLDGEMFDPGPDGMITLSADRKVDFVLP